MLRSIAVSVSMLAVLACGTKGQREPVIVDASPVDVPPEVLTVMIAAARLIIDSASSRGTPSAYCLSVGPLSATPKEPSAALLAGLADVAPPVKSLSICEHDPRTGRLWLEGTHQAAWWIFVTVPKLRDSTGFIGAGYEKASLNAAGYDCGLKRVSAGWQIGQCRLSFAS